MQNLRIPGPTPCPPETLGELSRQMINHRGPEFADMQARIMDRLKKFFRTSNDVYVYTTSGTGAMEAAIVNTLSPGDKVLSISIGEFGDRFGEIAAAYGANVTRYNFDPGTEADAAVDRPGAGQGPGVQGSARHAQRDLDRRDQRHPGHRQGLPRRQP